ncbi:STAS domain-containing protein [Mycobacterium sp. CVI_P3]|uniref:STAS domain-containing protein n=1 Tax=Mycobacterium pinniadriaticum TaxID=2994102 RepID=A0ABT3S802_9MYCO|nr:STAS domain-containing protein [Mycobacterium pinniadriaticum]MCX2929199.1 STAS domain-containing protein [Mycobacterium pinniadriaticum]MCX2935624.1 STAS domain-containing protein [Mycobacterium pinniadriaticum]
MSVATTAAPLAVTRSGRDRADHGLFRARELGSTTVLVAAAGEIDASNSGDLLSYLEALLPGHDQLVLDLSKLSFFGIDGFSALHTVGSRCSRRGVDWVLVPGPEVTRVLRVCDPEAQLATAGNIVSAMAVLARGPHTHLQLAPLPK